MAGNAARLRAGEGDPLLLIHPGWTTWRAWTPLLAELGSDRDVLAPTLPGHLGGPPLPDARPLSFDMFVDGLERELDQAGFDRADIVGNSIGAWAALELARRDRARRVVAMAPMGMQTPQQARRIERRMARLSLAVRTSRHPAWALMQSPLGRRLLLRDMTSGGHRLPPELARHLLAAFIHWRPGELFNAIRESDGSLPTIHDPQEITVPVLLVWGDRDPVATRDQIDRYLGALPNAELVTFEGLGHCPQLDDPRAVGAAVHGFLAPPVRRTRGRMATRLVERMRPVG